MSVGKMRRALDSLVLVEILDDLLHLARIITEPIERAWHGLIDDLEHPAADQFLVLDQRDIGLDAGRVAIHHESDRAGGRNHGSLRIAIADGAPELQRVVPDVAGSLPQFQRHVLGLELFASAVAMTLDYLKHRLAIDRIALERAERPGDPRRLQIG